MTHCDHDPRIRVEEDDCGFVVTEYGDSSDYGTHRCPTIEAAVGTVRALGFEPNHEAVAWCIGAPTSEVAKTVLSHQQAYDLLRDAHRDGRLPAGMSIRLVRGRSLASFESRTTHEYSVVDGFSEERYPSLQAIVIEYNLTEGASASSEDDEAFPLCEDCVDNIGGAGAGPDAIWRPAAEGEACGAADCVQDIVADAEYRARLDAEYR